MSKEIKKGTNDYTLATSTDLPTLSNQIEIDEKKPIGALNIIQPSPYSEKLKYNSFLHIYYLYIGKTLCFYPPYKKIPPNMPIPNPPFSIGPQCNHIH